jgi:hypothetical protein
MHKFYKHNSMHILVHRDFHQLKKSHMGLYALSHMSQSSHVIILVSKVEEDGQCFSKKVLRIAGGFWSRNTVVVVFCCSDLNCGVFFKKISMIIHGTVLCLFLHTPHKKFVSSKNFCANIECLNVHAKFYLGFYFKILYA